MLRGTKRALWLLKIEIIEEQMFLLLVLVSACHCLIARISQFHGRTVSMLGLLVLHQVTVVHRLLIITEAISALVVTWKELWLR